MRPTNIEEIVYQSVVSGELEIDNNGRIWRVKRKGWDRWNRTTRLNNCKRRRAEHKIPQGYLQIRAMFDLKRYHALAHRLVWLHFFGQIPKGKTINHKNGIKNDNRPANMEIATYSDQIKHAIHVLGHHKNRNSMGRFSGAL